MFPWELQSLRQFGLRSSSSSIKAPWPALVLILILLMRTIIVKSQWLMVETLKVHFLTDQFCWRFEVLIRIWATIPFMEVIHFQLRTRGGVSIFRTSTMIRRNWKWRSLHRRYSCSNRRGSILKWCLNLWGVSKKQTKWKWDRSMFWNGNWVRPTF